jgi:hypothetical protein
LKRIPELRCLPAIALRPVILEWFERSKEAIGTKDFETTWTDFRSAWGRTEANFEGWLDAAFRTSCEQTPPAWMVERYNHDGNTPRAVRLLMLCRELARGRKSRQFFLSQREAALLLEMSQPAVSMYLREFRDDGVIEQLGEKDPTRRLANEYRYLGPLREKP